MTEEFVIRKSKPTWLFGKPYIWVQSTQTGQWRLYKYEVDQDEEKGYLER